MTRETDRMTAHGTGRVIYGVGPVRELLSRKPRDIVVLYVRETRGKRDAVDDIVRDARGRGVAVEERARGELEALAGDRHHQGVVAVAGEYPYVDIEDTLSSISSLPAGEPALLVALDSVQDPHNFGAIVRSAHVLGAHGVLVPRDRAAGVTAVVTKASAGATEHMPIAQVTNLVRALEQLKQAGVWLAAVAAGPGAQPIDELDATIPICLVLGAEGTGIRALVSRTCDFHVEIPMAGSGVGSLNVSVAAGVALYEITRQRRQRRAPSA